jgi:hypothetical protein
MSTEDRTNRQPILRTFLHPGGIDLFAANRRGPGLLIIASLAAGLIYGFNFFWSNFIIDIRPLSFVLPTAGVFLAYALFALYFLLYLCLRRFFVPCSAPSSQALEPLRIAYFFFFPFLFFQFFLLVLNIILLQFDLMAVVVYINDYFRFFIYAWILAATVSEIHKKAVTYSYRRGFLLIVSFGLAFLLLTVALKQVQLAAADFFR